MALDQRPLEEADLDQMWEIEREAFNVEPSHQEHWRKWERAIGPERIEGLFEDGRLVAMAGVLAFGQWFGGRVIPMGGVRAVAVRPERRGRGYATRVVRGAIDAMHRRGETISVLFPQVTRPYRNLGWEIAGAVVYRQVPTRSLAQIAVPDVTVRRASERDHEAIRACYARGAREHSGWVDRPSGRWEWFFDRFSDEQLYVAGDDGYVLYRHLPLPPTAPPDGFNLLVLELVATTAIAWRALWTLVAASAAIAPTTYFRGGGVDPLPMQLAAPDVTILRERPWMLRLVDAPAAVSARGFPDGAPCAVPLEIADPTCTWNAGRVRLVVEQGRGRLEPGGTGAVRVGIGALSALFSGHATTSLLARAGLLEGGSDGDRAALDRLFAGPLPWMFDEF